MSYKLSTVFRLFGRLSWLFRWNAEALPCDQKLAQGFEVRLTVATPTAQDFEDPWGWTCGRRLRRRLPDDHPAAKDIGNRPDVPVGSIYFDQKLTTVTGEL